MSLLLESIWSQLYTYPLGMCRWQLIYRTLDNNNLQGTGYTHPRSSAQSCCQWCQQGKAGSRNQFHWGSRIPQGMGLARYRLYNGNLLDTRNMTRHLQKLKRTSKTLVYMPLEDTRSVNTGKRSRDHKSFTSFKIEEFIYTHGLAKITK